jgi:hypothetical protein
LYPPCWLEKDDVSCRWRTGSVCHEVQAFTSCSNTLCHYFFFQRLREIFENFLRFLRVCLLLILVINSSFKCIEYILLGAHKFKSTILMKRTLNHQNQYWKNTAGHWWLTAVILATWEAEIRRTTVQGQPGQRIHENLSPK